MTEETPREVTLRQKWLCEVSGCKGDALFFGNLDEEAVKEDGDFHILRSASMLHELYGNFAVCQTHKHYLLNTEVIQ
jgi:hypothetical protein